MKFNLKYLAKRKFCCCRSGELFYYKLGQQLLEIETAITNWDSCYKSVHNKVNLSLHCHSFSWESKKHINYGTNLLLASHLGSLILTKVRKHCFEKLKGKLKGRLIYTGNSRVQMCEN